VDYTSLKESANDWMHRADLSDKMDLFIDLFEAHANVALRVPEMEQRSTTTPTDEYVAFPTGFLELRNIQINTTPPKLLEYAPPQKIDALRLTGGNPQYYTVVGNQFQINPSASGSEVEISFYREIPALSLTNTTNWLIDGYENYYLMGVVYNAMLYAADPRYAAIEGQLRGIESIINMRGRGKNYGTGPLSVTAA